MTAPALTSIRSSGILLHPTSLPGPYGIGDLGNQAYQWVDALGHAQQRWWQILPLNPTGYGDSPYQSYSAFAGNPYLISPDLLVEYGLVGRGDLPEDHYNPDRVDYGRAIDSKILLLWKAWERFKSGAAVPIKQEFEEYKEKQSHWLDDYVLFRAIKDVQNGKAWYEWPKELLERLPQALKLAQAEYADQVGFHAFCQFLFYKQWQALRDYAHSRHILILGDAPIFVASDSADVWSHPELFQLDSSRRPSVVAGVPPDYFSATGQLWGNPLYNWSRLKKSGFQWWIDRMRTMLDSVDVIRIDHFRGLESYWEVPAGMPTAEIGEWVKVPGAELFQTLREALGGLPFVAEDLGIITPEVDALRNQFDLPGMKVLQFAFGGGSDNPYLPHNYVQNTVVYTGTHDNNTTRGWYNQAPESEKDHVRRYLARDGSDIAWDFIRLAWSSVGNTAIAPLQDVMDLDAEGRMNFPGHSLGNWGWRFRQDQLHTGILDRLAELTELFGRSQETH